MQILLGAAKEYLLAFDSTQVLHMFTHGPTSAQARNGLHPASRIVTGLRARAAFVCFCLLLFDPRGLV